MHVIIPRRLSDSEVLRPTDRAECPESGAMFPVPQDLVGLTVSEARTRWCGDVLDESPPTFYRVPDPLVCDAITLSTNP